jgi:hypothetical protein
MININNLGSIHPAGGLSYDLLEEKSGFKNKRNISLSLDQSSLKCKEAKCGRGEGRGSFCLTRTSLRSFMTRNCPRILQIENASTRELVHVFLEMIVV